MNIYNDTDKSSNSDLSGESTKIENCWNGDQELELNIIKLKCQTYALVGVYTPPPPPSQIGEIEG